MSEEYRPDYLYNPELCPCQNGAAGNCPRWRNCEACQEHHHNSEKSPLTACEKKAAKEAEERRKNQG